MVYTAQATDDKITYLPRSTKLKSNQFSGYLKISAKKRIHYFYIESENDPVNDPVVFW
jgi:cathepsin A (carboxypeptidase C)